MQHENDLQQMAVGDLAQRCAQETQNYLKQQRHETGYCFELFRRAIVRRDNEAWDAVYTQYRPQVERWAHRLCRMHGLAQVNEDTQDFTVQAFARFSKHFTEEKLGKSQSLAAVLRYLQMCVNGAITDAWRKTQRIKLEQDARDEEQEPSEPDPTPEDRIQAAEFWQMVKKKARDPKEYIVVYASFHENLSPREILAAYPNEFKGIKEIYQHKANFLERLERDDEMKEFVRRR